MGSPHPNFVRIGYVCHIRFPQMCMNMALRGQEKPLNTLFYRRPKPNNFAVHGNSLLDDFVAIKRYKTWNLDKVSHEMLILDFQHVPSWFHCFLWHRRAYGKNGQILNFWTFQTKLYLSFSSGRDTSWQADRFQNVATIQNSVVLCDRHDSLDLSILIRRGRRSTPGVLLRVLCESHFQGCVEWWQRADCLARVGYLESALLRGRRSIWCRSVVCGVPCVARAIYWDTLHFTLCTCHSSLYTQRHSAHYSAL